MNNIISIKTIEKNHIPKIVTAFKGTIKSVEGFEKYINHCFNQNETKERVTFVAFVNNYVAGIVNLIYKSSYPHFMEKKIPEINDLRVLLNYRNKGIGKMLIHECEGHASHYFDCIGLGVGLYKDYGNAQRLYTKNGYILDGNGIMYNNAEVKPGYDVFVDDDLLLYLYKRLNNPIE